MGRCRREEGLSKTKPLVTSDAFVYLFGNVEKENIIGPFTLWTSWQVFDELDFITINGHFW